MIFGLAFQRPAHSKTIYRTNWELRENHHKKKNFSGYEKRAFPRRKVEDILVSKRFFTTASQAWFSTHTWTIDHAQWYYSSAYQFLTQENGLFTQYARGLIVNYTCLARPISKMIGLRELEMQLDEYTFDGLELPDRYAWEHRLEEHELAGLPMLETIGQMTRLNSFSLSLEEQWYIYAKTDSQVELLRTNIKALESVFLERMEVAKWKHASTSRRKSKSPPRACVPLYYGSQVCASCSRMHGFESTHMPFPHQGRDDMTTQITEQSSKSSRRRPRRLRTASIPNDRQQIKQLLRSHQQQIVDYLFEARRVHDAKAWANRRRRKARKQRRV